MASQRTSAYVLLAFIVGPLVLVAWAATLSSCLDQTTVLAPCLPDTVHADTCQPMPQCVDLKPGAHP